MISTAIDLIKGACKEIEAIGQGEALESEEANDALDRLNMMMESWSLDKLFVYAEQLYNFPLTNQLSFTVGPGGNFNIPVVPTKLTGAYTRDQYGTDYQIQIFNDSSQYDDIVNKFVGGSYPSVAWYQYNVGLATLFVAPVTSGYTLFLRFWGQLQIFPTLTTQIDLPIGYKEAMMLALAPRLAPMFGLQPSPATLANATSAVARLKRFNIQRPVMFNETSMLGSGKKTFNIYTGRA